MPLPSSSAVTFLLQQRVLLVCFDSSALQERAAREAAERERLSQQNEAARLAVKQRAELGRQQRQQEEQEEQARRQQRQQQQHQAGGAGGSQYLRRLQARQPGGQQSAAVPEWAKLARPLPPLLLPKGNLSLAKLAAPQERAQAAAAPPPAQSLLEPQLQQACGSGEQQRAGGPVSSGSQMQLGRQQQQQQEQQQGTVRPLGQPLAY